VRNSGCSALPAPDVDRADMADAKPSPAGAASRTRVDVAARAGAHLASKRTCLQRARTESRDLREMLERFNAWAAHLLGRTDDGVPRLQDRRDAADAWKPRLALGQGDGTRRAGLTPRRRRRDPSWSGAERARVSASRLLLASAVLLLLDDVRHQSRSTKRSNARTPLEEYKGNPSSRTTHGRYFLGPTRRAGSRSWTAATGIRSRDLIELARAEKRKRPRPRGEAPRPHASARSPAEVEWGAHEPEGAARERPKALNLN